MQSDSNRSANDNNKHRVSPSYSERSKRVDFLNSQQIIYAINHF